MKKVYEVRVRSKRYTGNSEKSFSLLAGSVSQAIVKAKKFLEWHEEITSVSLLTELD